MLKKYTIIIMEMKYQNDVDYVFSRNEKQCLHLKVTWRPLYDDNEINK